MLTHLNHEGSRCLNLTKLVLNFASNCRVSGGRKRLHVTFPKQSHVTFKCTDTKSISCFRLGDLWQIENSTVVNGVTVKWGVSRSLTAQIDASWGNKDPNNGRHILQQYILNSIHKSHYPFIVLEMFFFEAQPNPLVPARCLNWKPSKKTPGGSRLDMCTTLTLKITVASPASAAHTRCSFTRSRLFTDCQRIETINGLLPRALLLASSPGHPQPQGLQLHISFSLPRR